mmetsp:Transcript_24397/g.54347  ORF Transcript_24397/g.54347 Transcript_24397/m.54347 type:complete len:189 (-) Transcript_24397:72-638(-)
MAAYTQPVPATMTPDGGQMGARMKPTCPSLFFCAPCAISGYIRGDPTDGSCEGPALTALLLNLFLCIAGSIYAVLVWKPDPSQIQGDGTQRTINNICLAVFCTSGPCIISFWKEGDFCTGCVQGEACIALALNIIGPEIFAPSLGDLYTCCCWKPTHAQFKRSPDMDGGKSAGQQVGTATAVVVNNAT